MFVDQLQIPMHILLQDDEVFYQRLPDCEVVDRRIRVDDGAVLEEFLRLFVHCLVLHQRVRVRWRGWTLGLRFLVVDLLLFRLAVIRLSELTCIAVAHRFCVPYKGDKGGCDKEIFWNLTWPNSLRSVL
jgi:hypothetical protein